MGEMEENWGRVLRQRFLPMGDNRFAKCSRNYEDAIPGSTNKNFFLNFPHTMSFSQCAFEIIR